MELQDMRMDLTELLAEATSKDWKVNTERGVRSIHTREVAHRIEHELSTMDRIALNCSVKLGQPNPDMLVIEYAQYFIMKDIEEEKAKEDIENYN